MVVICVSLLSTMRTGDVNSSVDDLVTMGFETEELEEYEDEAPVLGADSTQTYISTIYQIPRLSSERQAELFRTYAVGRESEQRLKEVEASGDATEAEVRALKADIARGERSKKTLVESNLRLVVMVARRYNDFGIPLPDLVQEGSIGLIRAIEKFDPSMGFQLSTYATYWIEQAIRRAIRAQATAVRLTDNAIEKVKKIKEVATELKQKLRRDPTTVELSKATGIFSYEIVLLMTASGKPAALDAPLYDDGSEDCDVTLCDSVTDSNAVEPEDCAFNQLLKEDIQDALQTLDETERTIIQYYYGIKDGYAYTPKEIAKMLHMTQYSVGQLKNRALRKLRVNCVLRQHNPNTFSLN